MCNAEKLEYKPVLAMYDIRGKQEFVFRTNKLQEIVGASWIIRDCFNDYLFSAAKKVADKYNKNGIYSYKMAGKELGQKEDLSFNFEKRRESYIGEVVYDGGGNFLLVFVNENVFKEVTYEFTKSVMMSTGSLRVLATCVPVTNGDYSRYKFKQEDKKEVGDLSKLYAKHRIAEAEESNLTPWACIPIVQVDRKNSRPLCDYRKNDAKDELDVSIRKSIESKGVKGKLTKESYAKLKKFFTECKRIKEKDGSGTVGLSEEIRELYYKNVEKLDELVEEKGRDSQLAVVYIDGNNMGAKVERILDGLETYVACSDKLREFSDDIQNKYVEKGLINAFSGLDNEGRFRVVVSAGDEINFIVKAKDAFPCAKAYLDYLKNPNSDKSTSDEKSKDDASACAGIAVFHSHSPYADAYRIAEEACESGKQKMKKLGLNVASFVDFHICQGAIGVSLDRIRDDENGGEDNISRPWMVWCKDEILKENVSDVVDYEKEVKRVIDILSVFSRSNVKGLAAAAKNGDVELTMQLNRMYSHLPESKKESNILKKEDWAWLVGESEDCLNPEKRRKIIYDVSIAYDLWFNNSKPDVTADNSNTEGKNNAD